MIELAGYLGFVADMFEAALSDEGWRNAASLVARALGVNQAAIVVNRHGGMPDVSVTASILEFKDRYDLRYQQLDPWAERRRLLKVRGVFLASEIFPEEQLVKTEFYNDYARHIGMFRPMTADLVTQAGHTLEIGAEQPFSRLRFEAPDKARLDVLAPYIARAVDLRQSLRLARLNEALGGSLLETWAMPAVVCDGEGRILIANAGAEALERSGFFGLAGGQLRLPALHPALVARARAMIAGAGTTGLGGAFSVRDPRTNTLRMVLVSPLPASLAEGRSLVLVTVGDSSSRPVAPATLRAMFNLSPAQVELALALYDGVSLEEYALRRNVRISTLRTQLSQLFERVGVKSQKDLVAVLARIPQIGAR